MGGTWRPRRSYFESAVKWLWARCAFSAVCPVRLLVIARPFSQLSSHGLCVNTASLGFLEQNPVEPEFKIERKVMGRTPSFINESWLIIVDSRVWLNSHKYICDCSRDLKQMLLPWLLDFSDNVSWLLSSLCSRPYLSILASISDESIYKRHCRKKSTLMSGGNTIISNAMKGWMIQYSVLVVVGSLRREYGDQGRVQDFWSTSL